MKKEMFIESCVSATDVELNNEAVIRVEKTEKIWEPDVESFAKLKDMDFGNGTISVKMYSRLLKDAPEHARGFIGIAYRINEDNTKFESFYVRPTNGRNCNDPIRYNRSIQYFSFPTYTFDYFRNKEITDYEGHCDIDLDEWIDLRAEIKDETAKFYVNNELVLTVEKMFHGATLRGSVGLFVDIGTEAFYKDLVITHE